MRIVEAQVQNYRSVRDSGTFEVEGEKTILVGPNEAGKTVLLRALQQINPPPDTPGFDPLRDYPRSQYNDITTGKVNAANCVVVKVKFSLEPDDIAAVAKIDEASSGCTYVHWKNLDNSFGHRLEGENLPVQPLYRDVQKDLAALAAYCSTRNKSDPAAPDPKEQLSAVTAGWLSAKQIAGDAADQLRSWLDGIVGLVDTSGSEHDARYDRLRVAVDIAATRDAICALLKDRVPLFVYFNNYFRVRPRIHLAHLATRQSQDLLEDGAYDYGNLCLLKLLGFTAAELSAMGAVGTPGMDEPAAVEQYQAQLDSRRYQLNAASVRLTQHIRDIWQPDPSKGEAAQLRVLADGQYLKVVVEDALGVEIELDQRSEGLQWLVSFFVVFFAEAADAHKNAVLLLDEPGMSLHGLRQRDFRTTISKLAADNQTLFSTHSPFLVGPDELDKVRVVEMVDRTVGTKVHTTVTSSDPAALLPLQEALGYDLAQSLFAAQRNLVLEGLTDFWYLDATAQLLDDASIVTLNDKIALVPANSAGKVVYFATILHAHSLKVAALLDSDAAGDEAAKQDTLVHTLGNSRILRTKDSYKGAVAKPEVEDLLRETLVAVAKADLGWDVAATAAAQPTRPIVELFANEITGFSKYRLAKAYLRWTQNHAASDLAAGEADQWTDLIAKVNKALR